MKTQNFKLYGSLGLIIIAFVMFSMPVSASDLTINSGTTTLGGNQVYGSVYVASGGTLAVDSTIGWLNITATNITILGTIDGSLKSTSAGTGGGSTTAHAGNPGTNNVGGTGGGGGGEGGGSYNPGSAGSAGISNTTIIGTQTGRSEVTIIGGGSAGGGAGGSAWDGNQHAGYSGDRGGGTIRLNAQYIKISGTINVNGATGGTGGYGSGGTFAGNAGGGGGGGGAGGQSGQIIIDGNNVNISSATLNANGGSGGTGGVGGSSSSGDGANGIAGQPGSGGRIKIFYGKIENSSISQSVTGTTTGTIYYSQANNYTEASLTSPVNNYYSYSPITFTCGGNAYNTTLKNITLFLNSTGTFTANETKTISGSSDSETFSKTFGNGFYKWNCYVCSNDNNCVFAPSNYTFHIYNDAPLINLVYPIGTINYGAFGQNISLNYSIQTGDTLNTCWYNYNNTNYTMSCTSNSSLILTNDKSITLYANDSLGNLGSSSYSWDYVLFANSQTYNPSAYETAIEPFSINLTYGSGIINIVGILNYKNINYSTTKVTYGNNVIFSTNLDMPLITSSSTNNFNWIITTYTNLGTTQIMSPINNQTLNQIHLEKCNATYTIPTLNFTAYGENDSLRISPFSIVSAFNYWLGSGNTYKTLSLINSADSIALCISPVDRTFYSTATLEYSASGYLARDYYLSNATLTNVTNNISLYLLDTASATSFIEEVLDTGRNPVSNAIIYIQRCYGFSCTTVQMAKTDVNGRTIGFYKTETVDYQHIIIKDGQVIYTDSPHKIFGLSVPYTNQFFVGNASVLNFNPNGIANLWESLTYDNNTQQVTYSYIDTSGLFQNGRLFVDFFNMSGVNPIICNVTSYSSSANLYCNMNTYPEGTYTAVGYITRSIEQVADYITFAITSAGSDMGNYGLFLGMLIIITAGMAFLYHPVAGAWGVTIAMIFTNIVHLTKFTGIWIFGVIFFAILFTWLFKD